MVTEAFIADQCGGEIMHSFARRFSRYRWTTVITVVVAVAVMAAGLASVAKAYPGPEDRDCPKSGPCETVIRASDGNTYYCGNYGGGHGYVVQVGANGKVGDTIEVTASPKEVVLKQGERGRRLTLRGPDLRRSGIFSGEGTSRDIAINTVNVNGNGYIEYAADPSRMLHARVRTQVIGGDGVVYHSDFYDRQDPKLQSAFKDYMQGATALNTATTRLQALLAGAGGVSTTAVVGLLVGVSSKTFSEANVITSVAALGILGISVIIQVYNAWRDVDTARNNLINLFNNLAVTVGANPRPIPMVVFGGITAQNIGQNPFHSFRV